MSHLAKRTTHKPVRIQNARRAINRISAELDALIEHAPESHAGERLTARNSVVMTLNLILRRLYGVTTP